MRGPVAHGGLPSVRVEWGCLMPSNARCTIAALAALFAVSSPAHARQDPHPVLDTDVTAMRDATSLGDTDVAVGDIFDLAGGADAGTEGAT